MSLGLILKDFAGKTSGDITINQLKILHEELQKVKTQDLVSIDDHIAYLNVLRSFRLANLESTNLVGKNFLSQITSLLGVGEDGVYSNRFRFLYELIQNVDDCDYRNQETPMLDIRFSDIDNVIELTYNELGFTPQNVFEITAIAGGTKNQDETKLEIGEKGIGFKSVFGIAESVLIQSGLFSFSLEKNQFTVPQPQYGQEFDGVAGTRMTLKLKDKFVHDIYQELVELYSTPSALLDRNPVLFLNKLLSIRFYVDDSFRYIVFTASRKGTERFGEEILISADIAHPNKQEVHNSIHCYRYKVNVDFDSDACLARYGDKKLYKSKRHQIIGVVPQVVDITKFGKRGVLYSFLPTQIKLTLPLLLHVPYKLDVSREYVDSQNGNKWFADTNKYLSAFFYSLYSSLSSVVKAQIVSYLPARIQYFFGDEHEKGKCLRIPLLRGDILSHLSLFCCADGVFRKSEDVTSFLDLDEQFNPIEIHNLLSIQKALFISPIHRNLSGFGIEVISDAYSRLLRQAIHNPSITARAFEILTAKGIDLEREIADMVPFTILQEQEVAVLGCNTIMTALQTIAQKHIKTGKLPPYDWAGAMESVQEPLLNIISSILEDLDPKVNVVKKYIDNIKLKIFSSKHVEKDDYLACSNTLILSSALPLSSFSSFAEAFGMKSMTAQLRMRQESIRLDDLVLDEKISSEDFLVSLRIVRKSVMTILGNSYNNYVKLVNDAGVDQNRFIKELIQNADDCNFSNPETLAKFSCQFSDSSLITRCNEDGFSKENVRSITAIGESTKKRILDSSSIEKIGEKGVGFKSVFSVASEVDIHSNGFHFVLRDDRPTLPEKIDPRDSKHETVMLFRMKKPYTNKYFTEANVLENCLCLRKLKVLKLGTIDITIKDTEDSRTVVINGANYVFYKYTHSFTVVDEKALASRQGSERYINPSQKINIYVPSNNATKRALSRRLLYCGLPTSIIQNVMLIFDAPFETSTSRENIIHNSWNAVVRNELYNAYFGYLYSIRNEKKNDLFVHVNLENGLFSDAWLNDYRVVERLASEELVNMVDGSFKSPKKERCLVYPDVCLYSLNKSSNTPSTNIVNMARPLIYIWERIGCKAVSTSEIFDNIEQAINSKMMLDDDYRKLLYSWLIQNKQRIVSNTTILLRLRKLPMIPAKPLVGQQPAFISSGNEVYYGQDTNSSPEYYLLMENLMSVSDYNQIFLDPIPRMDIRLKQSMYRDKIIKWISSLDKKEAADRLLFEFNHNRGMIETCQNELRGQKERIPVKYMDGMYDVGNKFLPSIGNYIFQGSIIQSLLVDPKFHAFSEFLGCSRISNIHYDDIDIQIEDSISNEDLHDIINYGFVNKYEIIQGLNNDGLISDDLLIQYDLSGLSVPSIDLIRSNQVDFPRHPVKDLDRLRKHIQQMKFNKYQHIQRTRTERIPTFPFDDKSYTMQEYKLDQGYQVCQMCGNANLRKYFEAITIEYEPEYAWEQMQLCLCLHCSKDYTLLRNNREIRGDFIKALANIELGNNEPVVVSLANKDVRFTATHIAELREIIKLQQKKQII